MIGRRKEIEKDLKIIFTGAANSGKTFLISSFIFGHPVIPRKPTLFGSYSKEIEYNEKTYKLRLCDTCGSEDLFRLQEMAYLDVNLLVLCIDGSQKSSLKLAEEYALEAKKAKAPIVLCITKIDLGMNLDKKNIIEFQDQYGINIVIELSVQNRNSLNLAIEKMIEVGDDGILFETKCCSLFYY